MTNDVFSKNVWHTCAELTKTYFLRIHDQYQFKTFLAKSTDVWKISLFSVKTANRYWNNTITHSLCNSFKRKNDNRINQQKLQKYWNRFHEILIKFFMIDLIDEMIFVFFNIETFFRRYVKTSFSQFCLMQSIILNGTDRQF